MAFEPPGSEDAWGIRRLRDSCVATGDAGNVSICTIKVELAARPGGLESGELNVLPFEPALKRVLAINLGQVVSQLQCGGHLIRRQEGVTTQCLQAADSKGGQA